MRGLALTAIGLYQRYLFARKGFCCAYRVHTGRASCSALGARVIRRHGVLAGGVLLRRRLRRCGEVHRQFHPARRRPLAAQRGDCDPGCDAGCDGPGHCDGPGKGFPRLSDALDCCDCCDCDWPAKRKDKARPGRR